MILTSDQSKSVHDTGCPARCGHPDTLQGLSVWVPVGSEAHLAFNEENKDLVCILVQAGFASGEKEEHLGFM